MSGASDRHEVPGHYFLSTLKYLDATFPEEARMRILARIPPKTQDVLATLAGFEWYPVERIVDILAAVEAEFSSRDEAYHALVNLGHAIANDSVNTVLKLVIRVLTPQIFARKVSDIYGQHHNFGVMDVDRSEVKRKRLVITVDGTYPYLCAVGAGFLDFAWRAMGIKSVNIDETECGDSWASPRDRVRWVITW